MVFGTTVGLELGLLLLCYREGLRCDLWCLVLRQGLEHVLPEYQPFDRVTSSWFSCDTCLFACHEVI